MRNVHERAVRADVDTVADLIDALGGPNDRIWPTDRWPALEMSDGTNVGSAGGHSFVRYRVERSEHGRVVLRFEPSMRLEGTHAFEVEPVAGGTLVRHTIDAEPASMMRVAWPVFVRPLHDALIEDLLDGVEAVVAGESVVRGRLPRAALWRRKISALMKPRAVPGGSDGRTARAAGTATAAALALVAALHVAWGRGSTWPFDNHTTFVRAVLGRERPSSSAMPGAGPSFAVAALLGVAAISVGARPRSDAGAAPLVLADLATLTTVAALGARGVGGLVVSALGTPATTPEFRRHNLRVYSPLCVALALGAARARRV